MILEKLKKYPSDLILLIATATGIIILLAINIIIFEPMATAVYLYGILDFEFAWTKEQIALIFFTWGSQGMALQAAGVYWDFVYIFGYAIPLFAMILYLSRKLEDRIMTIGLYMSLTPLVAGIFDLIENINLLIMLNENPDFAPLVPLIASLSATTKFGFLIVGAIFFVVALVLFIVKKIKKQD
ncbi:MAG: hypothetical protein KGD61_05685 [Candidatus Lokiarchaeota archaeon]|nr:hypothetical protein [Candidatus Lokiarchaeota archaeon]